MDVDILQDEIDALLQQSDDAKRLGVVSVTLGRGADDADLTANAPVDVTLENQAPESFIIYSRAIIERFLQSGMTPYYGPSIPKGIFFSIEPMIIVEDVTPDTVLRGVLSYLEWEGNRRPSSPPKRAPSHEAKTFWSRLLKQRS